MRGCLWTYVHIYIYTKTFQGATFWNPYRVFLKGPHIDTPYRTKKTPQDMMTTMLIAPFLGEIVGGELNNKKKWSGKIRHANDTQSLVVTPCWHALRGAKTTPLSLKGWRFGTPANPTDTRMTRLTRAIFEVPPKKTQKHCFRGLR